MRKILPALFFFLIILCANQLSAQAPAITYTGPNSYPVGIAISNLSATNTGGAVPAGWYAKVTTLNKAGYSGPGIVTDAAHNIYIADGGGNLIRKVTPAGVVSVFAGNGQQGSTNGTGTAARFSNPQGLAIDASGYIYVADAGNNLIRKISPYGVVSTFAGSGSAGSGNGSATMAAFSNPQGLAVDASGNIYVADVNNQQIRKITPAGTVSNFAGSGSYSSVNGTGTAASFRTPTAIAIDASGNLFVTERDAYLIRKITPGRVVTTFAGTGNQAIEDGNGTTAAFESPRSICRDAAGNFYVTDGNGNNYLRKITASGTVTTIAGAAGSVRTDGIGSAATFSNLQGITCDGNNLYVLDNNLRKVAITGYTVSPALPAGLEFNETTGTISGTPLLASSAKTYSITGYNASGSSKATVSIATTGTLPAIAAGVMAPAFNYSTPKSYAAGAAITSLLPSHTGGAVPSTVYAQVTTRHSGLGTSMAMAFDANHNLYYADLGYNVIRKITPSGIKSIFAGTGSAGYKNATGTAASFDQIQGMVFDAGGNMFVSDGNNNVIRKITPAGVVTTFAGTGDEGRDDGSLSTATFDSPAGLAADRFGNLYVADMENHLIRKISPSGMVTTLAGGVNSGSANGTGSLAQFYYPTGVAVDANCNVYVTDKYNNGIRKITPAGVVTTVAGGSYGTSDGTGPAASFSYPTNITADAAGNLYVADNNSGRIRRVTTAGVVTTLAGGAQYGDGVGSNAGFSNPQAIAIDNGTLYISDNGAVRSIETAGYTIAPALPAGLYFDQTTGAISGTPLVASPAKNYTITAYNAGGSSSATLNLTVTGTIVNTPPVVPAPSITYTGPNSYAAGAVITDLVPANSGGAVPGGLYAQVSTVAKSVGSNVLGSAVDAEHNVYVADQSTHTIRKISSDGTVSILAGSGAEGKANGTGTSASFSYPKGLATDAAGNVYVADGHNNLIRKITPAGVVSTYAGTGSEGQADGPATTATFSDPTGLAMDRFGNLYVGETGNRVIRRISPDGIVTTLAGNRDLSGVVDGTGTAASFYTVYGLTVDGIGNVYVADHQGQRIRKVTPAGVVTTLAGNDNTQVTNGTGAAASFYYPTTLAADYAGNIYVTETGGLLRRITPAGVVTTLAGGNSTITDGTGTNAGFSTTSGISYDRNGSLYLVDGGSLRKISLTGFSITPALPAGLSFNDANGTISGTPTTASGAKTYTIGAYNAAGGGTATVSIAVTGSTSAPAVVAAPAIAYAGPQTYATGSAVSLSPSNTGGAIPATIFGQTVAFAGSGKAGLNDGAGAQATFSNPVASTTDAFGNVYVADNNGTLIRKITPAGVVTTLAGSGTNGSANGTGTAASFYGIQGLATDAAGNVYVADMYNNLIRKVTPAGVVTTLAGSGTGGSDDGTGVAASFNYPVGVAVDNQGAVYVADYYNQKIRKITSAGVVSTLAGSGSYGYQDGPGTSATFNYPRNIAVDASRNVYVSDYYGNRIRKITTAGVVSTFAGDENAQSGTLDGTGTAALFLSPQSITIDKANNLYVVDNSFNTIRKISPSRVVTTVANISVALSTNGNPFLTLAADTYGNVYYTDATGNAIKKVTLTGYTSDSGLPAGLKFDGTTGIISGTPTAPVSAANYTITAYNAGGSSSATVNIGVTGTAVQPVVVAKPQITYNGPLTFTAGSSIAPILPVNSGGAIPATPYMQTSTIYKSAFYGMGSFVKDADGNLYVVDGYYGAQIRKVTPDGKSSVLAGNNSYGFTNGKGSAASFYGIQGMAIDLQGNLYVTDNGNYAVRKITPGGVVTTLAGGTYGDLDGSGTAAQFRTLGGLVVDGGGVVYVVDQGNNTIRRITAAGTVTTFAGTAGVSGHNNATGAAASFYNPRGITIDKNNNLYVTEQGNNDVRKITSARVVTTVAGNWQASGFADGTGAAATFTGMDGIAADFEGNLYISGLYNLRRVTAAGVVTTVAGTGNQNYEEGIGSRAGFVSLGALFIDADGSLLANDGSGNIRKITTGGYRLTGNLPAGLTFDGATGTISGTPTSATTAANYNITAYNAGGSSSASVNIAVTGNITAPSPGIAPNISYASPKTYAVGTVISPLIPSNSGGIIPAAIYGKTTSIQVSQNYSYGNVSTDASGNKYVNYDNKLYKIADDGAIALFAGTGNTGRVNGPATGASFGQPVSTVFDTDGNMFVADRDNHLIRKISANGEVTTFAGTGLEGRVDGQASSATFRNPSTLTIDRFNNLYVGDNNNSIIRKITPGGVVTTLAGGPSSGYQDGNGANALFSGIAGLAADPVGNIFVSDANNHVIRKVAPNGTVTTYAGLAGTYGNSNGSLTSARFSSPQGIACDAAGNLYIADGNNLVVRKISAAGIVSTLAGSGTSGTADGVGLEAQFSSLSGVALDKNGNLYVSGYYNQLRKISTVGYKLDTPLPAGLSFDATTGTITGMPLQATPAANYNITAYNIAGSSTTSLNLTTTGALTAPAPAIAAPVISYATPQNYQAGVNIAALSPSSTGGTIPAAIYGQTGPHSVILPNGGAFTQLVSDADGVIYFTSNNQVYKNSPSDGISLFAGNIAAGAADGKGTEASFNQPSGLALDAAGNLFVADTYNHLIRKITPEGVVSTYAGDGRATSVNGSGTSVSFNYPTYLATDMFGNVYVAESNSYTIRRISATGVVTTVAGVTGQPGFVNGTGTQVRLGPILGMTTDPSGNLFVADQHAIRKITAVGVVSTFAGSTESGFVNGTGTAARFFSPQYLTSDAGGNIYLIDDANRAIRKITPAAVVTTVAGNGTLGMTNGIGTAATLYYPRSLSADTKGNLYFFDYNILRKVAIGGYALSGNLPAGLVFDGTTGTIAGTPLTASAATNYTVTAYNAGGSASAILNIAVTGTATPPSASAAPVLAYETPKTYGIGIPIPQLAPSNTGGAIAPGIYGAVTTFAGNGTQGSADGTALDATFTNIQSITTDIYGNVYITDPQNHLIRRITPAGVVTTLAGNGAQGFVNGTRTAASFNAPQGVAVDRNSNIYVADTYNNVIRKITPAGVVTTFAGSGNYGFANGAGTAATFAYPTAITTDKNNNVYVFDSNNYLIRKITPGGTVTTLAGSTGNMGTANGTGTNARFSYVRSISVDDNNNLYVADASSYSIRKITPSGVVTTFAGSGSPGFADGSGTSASFSNTLGLTIDAGNNLYVAEGENNLIRKVTPAGLVSTVAGNGSAGLANGIGTDVSFKKPTSIAADNNGNLYVADYDNNVIRKVNTSGYTINNNLPDGLAFEQTTGIIAGTPTTPSPATNYVITGTNPAGASAATVNITVIYPPVVITSAGVTAFTSMGDVPPVAVAVDPAASVTDLSKTTLASATLAITGNYSAAQDTLAFANDGLMGNISSSYSKATGTLTLSSEGAVATLAQWQAALRAVTYNNLDNVAPNTATRTITFKLNDGVIGGLTATKNIGLTYTPSHNANLNSLAASAGTLSPAFDQQTLSYVANVPNAVASVKITPLAASKNATITVNGAVVTSGASSGNIALNVGANTVTTLVTAQDQTTQKTYTITYTRAGIQTITFPALANKIYGSPDFAAGATSTNASIPVTLASSDSTIASIANGNIHINKVGTVTITASQAGNINWDPAAPVTQTLTITPATLSVIAADKSKTYGTDNPSLSFTYSGFVNGETSAIVATAPTASTVVTVATPAGTYPINVSGAVVPNYTVNYTAGTFTVNKAVLTIAADNKTKTYGAALPALTYTFSGFVNGDKQAVLTNLPTVNTSATASTAVGNYTITASGAAAANYAIAYTPGTLSITQASLTIKADNKTKLYGDINPVLTATYTGFVNGDSQAGLLTLPAFNTTATTTSPVGTYPITVSGASSANYSITYQPGTLTINAVPITFNPIASKVYGTADFAPGATSSSSVTYTSSNAAVATIVSGNIRVVGVGSTTITASNGSQTQTQTLTVTPAPLTVIANSASKAYGAVNPALGVTYSGFVNGDTQSALTTLPVTSTTATASSPAGSYPVTASGATAEKYTISYTAGTLTVDKAALTIAADNKSKMQGEANPPLTATYTGFVNGDSQASLTNSPTISTTATASSPAGTYPITVSGATAANYNIAYNAGTLTVTAPSLNFNAIAAKTYGDADFNPGATSQTAVTYTSSNTAVATISGSNIHINGAGTATITASNGISSATQSLTVNKAALTITADNKTRVQGTANPVLTATYSGFVNGEIASVLSSQPTLATTATATSAVGTYPITISGASSANYSITYMAGTLTVTPQDLIFAAIPAKTYGDADFSAGATGGTVTYTSSNTAVATIVSGNIHIAGAGTSTITASNGTSSATQTLTVNKAALTIAADNMSKEQGNANPSLTATFTGFVNGQTQAVLTTLPSLTTTATTSSPAGTYPITVSGAAAANYAISYTQGTLTITAPAVVTPVIASFSPAAAASGVTVIVNGSNFTGATTVSFGGVPAASFTVNSSTRITAVIGTGNSGSVSVTTSKGTGSLAGFEYRIPPSITYNTPQTFTVGKSMSLSPSISGSAVPAAVYATVNTLAGSSLAGATNATGSGASFRAPQAVAVDAAGNTYVADAGNHIIRKITPSGVVTTFAGSGATGSADGTATNATFNSPYGITIDPAGNLYVADNLANVIRMITPQGVVSTFAGSGATGSANGLGTAATFSSPVAVASDGSGNIYVADAGNHLIRKITPAGVVSTFAGSGSAGFSNGSGVAASFNYPAGLAADASGNLYVADANNNLIRRISAAGTVTTFAGSGTAATTDGVSLSASFNKPFGITLDMFGTIYVTDINSNKIRRITQAKAVTTIAGGAASGKANGVGAAATFSAPSGLAIDAAGNLVIADAGNNLIRKTVLSGYTITPALPAGINMNAGTGIITGTPTVSSTAKNYTVTAFNSGGSSSFVANIAIADALAKPVIAYQTPQVYTVGTDIGTLLPVNTGGAVPTRSYSNVITFAGNETAGAVDATGVAASFNSPNGIAKGASGTVYIADVKNHTIRKVTSAGVVTLFAGSSQGFVNGTGSAARFNSPTGVASDAAGNVYVADKDNNVIRKINPAGVVTTFAGSGSAGSANGTGAGASFRAPLGVATDVNGWVYVADAGNNLIRKISPTGAVTTLAGNGSAGAVNATGTAASFNQPVALVVDGSGTVYVSDRNNNLVRKITAAGVVTTLAGSGAAGAVNGNGTAASFDRPYGLTLDAAGYIYVADYNNHLIRRIHPNGDVVTIAGNATSIVKNAVGTTASFQNPLGIAFDGTGNLVLTDNANHLLRRIYLTGFKIAQPLSAGLVFTGSTGAISGNPIAAAAKKTYSISAFNLAGGSNVSLEITVKMPSVIAVTAPQIALASQTFTKGETITPVSVTNTGGIVPEAPYGNVTTLAGKDGISGYTNATGTSATFNGPRAVAADVFGNVYVADQNNQRIRKITSAGVVTTFAGSGLAGASSGTGVAASFRDPKGLTIDAAGNLYVGDTGNSRIRKITPDGVVTTLAGSTTGNVNGTGSAAKFSSPKGLAVDALGNIYVADQGNYQLRKITAAGVVTTLAGDGVAGQVNGTGTAARFANPIGVAVDSARNIYVTDGALIRKVTQAGVVTTLAGGASVVQDGSGTGAGFSGLTALTIDRAGNLYAVDGQKIRMITPAGLVTTVSGSSVSGSANGTAATFNDPYGLAVDAQGNLYIADTSNQLIRKMTVTGYAITPALPAGLSFDTGSGTISGVPAESVPSKQYSIIAGNNGGASVARFNLTINDPVPTVAAPSITYASQTFNAGTAISPLSPSNTGGAVPATAYAQVSTLAGSLNNAGFADATGTAARFDGPRGTTTDAAGNVYVIDQNNERVRKITPLGVVTTFAGSGATGNTNGAALSASFDGAKGIASDAAGNIYVADNNNNAVRKISNGIVSTLATVPGPRRIAADASGIMYVADESNNRVLKITQSGIVSVLAGSGADATVDGSGTAASFSSIGGLAADAAGNVYVSGSGFIRKISPAGMVTTLAGGASSQRDGTGSSAGFSTLLGLTVDKAGNIYAIDDNLIRMVTPAGVVTTIAGSGLSGAANAIGLAASFNDPYGLSLDNNGNLYIADTSNEIIRKITVTGYTITPALPNGLTFDATTGVISGTPSAASPQTSYTVRAFNTGGSSSATFTLQVNNAAPTNVAPNIAYSSQVFSKNVAIAPMSPVNTGGAVPQTYYGDLTYFAGNGSIGGTNGTGSAASFNTPLGIAVDTASGNVYIAEQGGYRIRKVTPAGVVTTLAGNGTQGTANGTGTAARFYSLGRMTIDAAGNLYAIDNSTIRKITPAGVVTTLPMSIFADGIALYGTNTFYFSAGNNIYKSTASGPVSIFAGGGIGSSDGTGENASFTGPMDIATDAAGNIYASGSGMLRKITPAGVVTTLPVSSGGGISITNDYFYFGGPYIKQVKRADNSHTWISGSDGDYDINGNPNQVLGGVQDVGVDIKRGFAYVADSFSHSIYRFTTTGYTLNKALPAGLWFDGSTGTISGMPTAALPQTSYTITAYNLYGSSSSTFTLKVNSPVDPNSAPAISMSNQTYTKDVAITPVGPTHTGGAVPQTIYSEVTTFAGSNLSGNVDGTGTAARFKSPAGVVFDHQGNLFVADHGHIIQKITPAGVVTTFAGSGVAGYADGVGTSASFNYPSGMVVDANDNVYVADRNNLRIRKITPSGVVTTVAGNGSLGTADGTGTAASFRNPWFLAIDAVGSIFISDEHRIRKMTPAGVVTTFVGSTASGSANGTGTGATFNSIAGIAFDSNGNLFASDYFNNMIRKITPAGVVTTFAGQLTSGQGDGNGTNASMNSPLGLAIDKLNNLYFTNTSLVRKISPSGMVTTLLGSGSTAGFADGIGRASRFNAAYGIVVSNEGHLFIADQANKRIRKMTGTGYELKPVYPGDPSVPPGMSFDATAGILSGTPTSIQSAKNYTITAYNLYGSSSSTFTITVNGPQTLAAKPNKTGDATALREPEFKEAGATVNSEPIVKQAVSPNGDGVNDVLLIDGIENFRDNKLTLMNRDGRAIYEVTHYDNVNRAFDGHTSDGRLQQAGTYFYLLQYKDADGNSKRKTGFFVLKY